MWNSVYNFVSAPFEAVTDYVGGTFAKRIVRHFLNKFLGEYLETPITSQKINSLSANKSQKLSNLALNVGKLNQQLGVSPFVITGMHIEELEIRMPLLDWSEDQKLQVSVKGVRIVLRMLTAEEQSGATRAFIQARQLAKNVKSEQDAEKARVGSLYAEPEEEDVAAPDNNSSKAPLLVFMDLLSGMMNRSEVSVEDISVSVECKSDSDNMSSKPCVAVVALTCREILARSSLNQQDEDKVSCDVSLRLRAVKVQVGLQQCFTSRTKRSSISYFLDTHKHLLPLPEVKKGLIFLENHPFPTLSEEARRIKAKRTHALDIVDSVYTLHSKLTHEVALDPILASGSVYLFDKVLLCDKCGAETKHTCAKCNGSAKPVTPILHTVVDNIEEISLIFTIGTVEEGVINPIESQLVTSLHSSLEQGGSGVLKEHLDSGFARDNSAQIAPETQLAIKISDVNVLLSPNVLSVLACTNVHSADPFPAPLPTVIYKQDNLLVSVEIARAQVCMTTQDGRAHYLEDSVVCSVDPLPARRTWSNMYQHLYTKRSMFIKGVVDEKLEPVPLSSQDAVWPINIFAVETPAARARAKLQCRDVGHFFLLRLHNTSVRTRVAVHGTKTVLDVQRLEALEGCPTVWKRVNRADLKNPVVSRVMTCSQTHSIQTVAVLASTTQRHALKCTISSCVHKPSSYSVMHDDRVTAGQRSEMCTLLTDHTLHQLQTVPTVDNFKQDLSEHIPIMMAPSATSLIDTDDVEPLALYYGTSDVPLALLPCPDNLVLRQNNNFEQLSNRVLVAFDRADIHMDLALIDRMETFLFSITNPHMFLYDKELNNNSEDPQPEFLLSPKSPLSSNFKTPDTTAASTKKPDVSNMHPCSQTFVSWNLLTLELFSHNPYLTNIVQTDTDLQICMDIKPEFNEECLLIESKDGHIAVSQHTNLLNHILSSLCFNEYPGLENGVAAVIDSALKGQDMVESPKAVSMERLLKEDYYTPHKDDVQTPSTHHHHQLMLTDQPEELKQLRTRYQLPSLVQAALGHTIDEDTRILHKTLIDMAKRPTSRITVVLPYLDMMMEYKHVDQRMKKTVLSVAPVIPMTLSALRGDRIPSSNGAQELLFSKQGINSLPYSTITVHMASAVDSIINVQTLPDTCPTDEIIKSVANVPFVNTQNDTHSATPNHMHPLVRLLLAVVQHPLASAVTAASKQDVFAKDIADSLQTELPITADLGPYPGSTVELGDRRDPVHRPKDTVSAALNLQDGTIDSAPPALELFPLCEQLQQLQAQVNVCIDIQSMRFEVNSTELAALTEFTSNINSRYLSAGAFLHQEYPLAQEDVVFITSNASAELKIEKKTEKSSLEQLEDTESPYWQLAQAYPVFTENMTQQDFCMTVRYSNLKDVNNELVEMDDRKIYYKALLEALGRISAVCTDEYELPVAFLHSLSTTKRSSLSKDVTGCLVDRYFMSLDGQNDNAHRLTLAIALDNATKNLPPVFPQFGSQKIDFSEKLLQQQANKLPSAAWWWLGILASVYIYQNDDTNTMFVSSVKLFTDQYDKAPPTPLDLSQMTLEELLPLAYSVSLMLTQYMRDTYHQSVDQNPISVVTNSILKPCAVDSIMKRELFEWKTKQFFYLNDGSRLQLDSSSKRQFIGYASTNGSANNAPMFEGSRGGHHTQSSNQSPNSKISKWTPKSEGEEYIGMYKSWDQEGQAIISKNGRYYYKTQENNEMDVDPRIFPSSSTQSTASHVYKSSTLNSFLVPYIYEGHIEQLYAQTTACFLMDTATDVKVYRSCNGYHEPNLTGAYTCVDCGKYVQDDDSNDENEFFSSALEKTQHMSMFKTALSSNYTRGDFFHTMRPQYLIDDDDDDDESEVFSSAIEKTQHMSMLKTALSHTKRPQNLSSELASVANVKENVVIPEEGEETEEDDEPKITILPLPDPVFHASQNAQNVVYLSLPRMVHTRMRKQVSADAVRRVPYTVTVNCMQLDLIVHPVETDQRTVMVSGQDQRVFVQPCISNATAYHGNPEFTNCTPLLSTAFEAYKQAWNSLVADQPLRITISGRNVQAFEHETNVYPTVNTADPNCFVIGMNTRQHLMQSRSRQVLGATVEQSLKHSQNGTHEWQGPSLVVTITLPRLFLPVVYNMKPTVLDGSLTNIHVLLQNTTLCADIRDLWMMRVSSLVVGRNEVTSMLSLAKKLSSEPLVDFQSSLLTLQAENPTTIDGNPNWFFKPNFLQLHLVVRKCLLDLSLPPTVTDSGILVHTPVRPVLAISSLSVEVAQGCPAVLQVQVAASAQLFLSSSVFTPTFLPRSDHGLSHAVFPYLSAHPSVDPHAATYREALDLCASKKLRHLPAPAFFAVPQNYSKSKWKYLRPKPRLLEVSTYASYNVSQFLLDNGFTPLLELEGLTLSVTTETQGNEATTFNSAFQTDQKENWKQRYHETVTVRNDIEVGFLNESCSLVPLPVSLDIERALYSRLLAHADNTGDSVVNNLRGKHRVYVNNNSCSIDTLRPYLLSSPVVVSDSVCYTKHPAVECTEINLPPYLLGTLISPSQLMHASLPNVADVTQAADLFDGRANCTSVQVHIDALTGGFCIDSCVAFGDWITMSSVPLKTPVSAPKSVAKSFKPVQPISETVPPTPAALGSLDLNTPVFEHASLLRSSITSAQHTAQFWNSSPAMAPLHAVPVSTGVVLPQLPDTLTSVQKDYFASAQSEADEWFMQDSENTAPIVTKHNHNELFQDIDAPQIMNNNSASAIHRRVNKPDRLALRTVVDLNKITSTVPPIRPNNTNVITVQRPDPEKGKFAVIPEYFPQYENTQYLPQHTMRSVPSVPVVAHPALLLGVYVSVGRVDIAFHSGLDHANNLQRKLHGVHLSPYFNENFKTRQLLPLQFPEMADTERTTLWPGFSEQEALVGAFLLPPTALRGKPIFSLTSLGVTVAANTYDVQPSCEEDVVVSIDDQLSTVSALKSSMAVKQNNVKLIDLQSESPFAEILSPLESHPAIPLHKSSNMRLDMVTKALQNETDIYVDLPVIKLNVHQSVEVHVTQALSACTLRTSYPYSTLVNDIYSRDVVLPTVEEEQQGRLGSVRVEPLILCVDYMTEGANYNQLINGSLTELFHLVNLQGLVQNVPAIRLNCVGPWSQLGPAVLKKLQEDMDRWGSGRDLFGATGTVAGLRDILLGCRELFMNPQRGSSLVTSGTLRVLQSSFVLFGDILDAGAQLTRDSEEVFDLTAADAEDSFVKVVASTGQSQLIKLRQQKSSMLLSSAGHGPRAALVHMRDGVARALQAVFVVPRQKSTLTRSTASLVRGLPALVLEPVTGTVKAVGVLLGSALDSVDSSAYKPKRKLR